MLGHKVEALCPESEATKPTDERDTLLAQNAALKAQVASLYKEYKEHLGERMAVGLTSDSFDSEIKKLLIATPTYIDAEDPASNEFLATLKLQWTRKHFYSYIAPDKAMDMLRGLLFEYGKTFNRALWLDKKLRNSRGEGLVLEEENTVLKAEITRLRTQLHDKAKKSSTAEAEHTETKKLACELREAQTRIAKLHAATAHIPALEAEITKLNTALQVASTRTAAAKSAATPVVVDAKKDALRIELRRLNQKISELKFEIAELSAQLAEKAAAVLAVEKENSELSQRLKLTETEVRATSGLLEAKTSECAILARDYARAQAEITTLKAQRVLVPGSAMMPPLLASSSAALLSSRSISKFCILPQEIAAIWAPRDSELNPHALPFYLTDASH